jgi:hypothetical protein
MQKHFKKGINEIKTIIDMPVAYTAAAILIAHDTSDELLQLAFQTGSRAWIDSSGFWRDLLLAFQSAFLTETAANRTAILAYYLLCVGVIAQ